MSDRPKVDSLPLAAPISVMPAPSPTEVAVREATDARGNKIVIMQFATQHGPHFYFLSSDAAKRVASALNEAASGILVVSAGAIKP